MRKKQEHISRWSKQDRAGLIRRLEFEHKTMLDHIRIMEQSANSFRKEIEKMKIAALKKPKKLPKEVDFIAKALNL